MTPLERLVRRIAAASDATADAAGTVDRARERALAGWIAGSRKRPRRAYVFAFAAALGALAVVLLLFVHRPGPAPMTFRVAGTERPIGEWIAANGVDLPVTFSDGTVLRITPSSRLRVTSTGANGAVLLLETGVVHAKVVHRGPETRWLIDAGPFVIRVVGTDLDAAWDPARDELRVGVTEGSVVVTGPLLGDGRLVAAGETLHVLVGQHRMEVTSGESWPRLDASACPPASAVASAETPSLPNQPIAAPGAAVGSASARPSSVGWYELEAAGKHREAMEAVDREGFAQVIARSSLGELLALSDAARYAGSYGHARDALLAARSRGGRGRSAFLLGKIAADHTGATGEAITWFQVYLAEEPAGGLAEQALGRLIELKKRAGDTTGAREAAEKYLASYPNGAYGALARTTLEP